MCVLHKSYYFLKALEVLLETLVRELKEDRSSSRNTSAQQVARRFVRSVARVFVIFSVEMAPNTAKRRML